MKLSVFGRRLHKLSVLLENPKALRLQLAGVGPDTYLQFNRPWFTKLELTSILDVGANRGQFAQALAAVVPALPIFAFEPLPECFLELSKVARRHQGIQPFQMAIGRSDGSTIIKQNPYSDSSSIRKMKELHRAQFPFTRGAEKSVEVEVRALDTVTQGLALGSRPFLKIDVQGYEDEVLAGATKLLHRLAAVVMEVSFEPLYENTPSFEDLDRTMRKAGFRFHGCISQLIGPNDGAILQGDALYVR